VHTITYVQSWQWIFYKIAISLSLYACSAAWVGMHIECGCPPATFIRSYPQTLSISPEAGSGEVNIAIPG
jgi:hypothetical protein